MSDIGTLGTAELSDIELEAFEAVANAMESAEHAIDTQFGTGYAEKHPAMLAGYLQAVAITYLADSLRPALREIVVELDGVRMSIDEVSRG